MSSNENCYFNFKGGEEVIELVQQFSKKIPKKEKEEFGQSIGESWLDKILPVSRATYKKLEHRLEKLEDKMEKLEDNMEKFEGKIESRLEKFEGKIESRLEKFEGKIESRLEKFDGKIENRFDRIEKILTQSQQK